MTDQHERIELLLPWHVNNTLTSDEGSEVERHIANCVACRSQLRELREMSSIVVEAAVPHFPVPEITAELDIPKLAHTGAEPPLRSVPIRWLLASQIAALLLVASLLVLRPGTPRPNSPDTTPAFRTLAAEPQPTETNLARVRVVFAEELTEQALRRLLLEVGGRMVDGPSTSGLYLIEFDIEAVDTVSAARQLELLRGHAGVRFAEAVGAKR